MLTELLEAAANGSAAAVAKLGPMVYDELRDMASGIMVGEARRVTVSPTVLVHEAWLKLAGPRDVPWESRRHFFGAAAWSMRRILVDHARRRHVHGDRGDVDVVELVAAPEWNGDGLLKVDRALAELEGHDARKHEVVMLRYFAGLSVEQTAAALDVSPRTVKREWRFARAWIVAHVETTEDAARGEARDGGRARGDDFDA